MTNWQHNIVRNWSAVLQSIGKHGQAIRPFLDRQHSHGLHLQNLESDQVVLFAN